jgi:hypothetical protein
MAAYIQGASSVLDAYSKVKDYSAQLNDNINVTVNSLTNSGINEGAILNEKVKDVFKGSYDSFNKLFGENTGSYESLVEILNNNGETTIGELKNNLAKDYKNLLPQLASMQAKLNNTVDLMNLSSHLINTRGLNDTQKQQLTIPLMTGIASEMSEIDLNVFNNNSVKNYVNRLLVLGAGVSADTNAEDKISEYMYQNILTSNANITSSIHNWINTKQVEMEEGYENDIDNALAVLGMRHQALNKSSVEDVNNILEIIENNPLVSSEKIKLPLLNHYSNLVNNISLRSDANTPSLIDAIGKSEEIIDDYIKDNVETLKADAQQRNKILDMIATNNKIREPNDVRYSAWSVLDAAKNIGDKKDASLVTNYNIASLINTHKDEYTALHKIEEFKGAAERDNWTVQQSEVMSGVVSRVNQNVNNYIAGLNNLDSAAFLKQINNKINEQIEQEFKSEDLINEIETENLLRFKEVTKAKAGLHAQKINQLNTMLAETNVSLGANSGSVVVNMYSELESLLENTIGQENAEARIENLFSSKDNISKVKNEIINIAVESGMEVNGLEGNSLREALQTNKDNLGENIIGRMFLQSAISTLSEAYYDRDNFSRIQQGMSYTNDNAKAAEILNGVHEKIIGNTVENYAQRSWKEGDSESQMFMRMTLLANAYNLFNISSAGANEGQTSYWLRSGQDAAMRAALVKGWSALAATSLGKTALSLEATGLWRSMDKAFGTKQNYLIKTDTEGNSQAYSSGKAGPGWEHRHMAMLWGFKDVVSLDTLHVNKTQGDQNERAAALEKLNALAKEGGREDVLLVDNYQAEQFMGLDTTQELLQAEKQDKNIIGMREVYDEKPGN